MPSTIKIGMSVFTSIGWILQSIGSTIMNGNYGNNLYAYGSLIYALGLVVTALGQILYNAGVIPELRSVYRKLGLSVSLIPATIITFLTAIFAYAVGAITAGNNTIGIVLMVVGTIIVYIATNYFNVPPIPTRRRR